MSSGEYEYDNGMVCSVTSRNSLRELLEVSSPSKLS